MELFENAPESGSFENGGFGSGSFLRVNMVCGSFLPLFPRRSKMACPRDKYCFTCMYSLVAEISSSSSFFFSKGVAFENKTEDGCCCLQKQLYLVVYSGEGRVFFFFVSFLLRLLFVFHFTFGAFLLSPASMIRTLLPWGTSTWRNTEERHWQAKETNKKKCDLSPSLSTNMKNTEAVPGGGTFPWINPRPCERGLRIDVRYVWTPQNGSFWKRIRVHVALVLPLLFFFFFFFFVPHLIHGVHMLSKKEILLLVGRVRVKRNDFLMTIPRERKVKLGADELSRRNWLVMAPVPVAQWYFTNRICREARLLAGLLVIFLSVSARASLPIPCCLLLSVFRLSIPFSFDLSFMLFLCFTTHWRSCFLSQFFFVVLLKHFLCCCSSCGLAEELAGETKKASKPTSSCGNVCDYLWIALCTLVLVVRLCLLVVQYWLELPPALVLCSAISFAWIFARFCCFPCFMLHRNLIVLHSLKCFFFSFFFVYLRSATWAMHSVVPAARTSVCLPSSLASKFPSRTDSCERIANQHKLECNHVMTTVVSHNYMIWSVSIFFIIQF